MSLTNGSGDVFRDDRMFVLYVCKCSVRISDDLKVTTIYHERAPEDHIWGVVTYRNVARYEPTRVDCFETEKEAIAFLQRLEPKIPLVSLGGQAPSDPLSFEQVQFWKVRNGYVDYNYKDMYPAGVADPQENIYSKLD